ncbi:MAG: SDR family NAD(P)-dependent oxidoreductase, partial [Alphaproteobacteria bacterium]|nr:SDR family NAD(P)-dependent oxidoreductase [Alphaproteobacteria bacterium]
MYLEKFRLDGKIAVVTGAARGIGFATADALSEAGAAVVITDMNGEAAKTAAAELAAKGRKISSATLDVTDPRAVERVHAEIVHDLGRVDILVNNAGISISNQPAEMMDDPTWLKVIDVNLNGVFWCCRTFGRAMLEQGG